jgi:hypothetical protein|tara:strand:- start:94 stop:366 length:273 start_codon:yes stop_codon:yes gene_type:complete
MIIPRYREMEFDLYRGDSPIQTIDDFRMGCLQGKVSTLVGVDNSKVFYDEDRKRMVVNVEGRFSLFGLEDAVNAVGFNLVNTRPERAEAA